MNSIYIVLGSNIEPDRNIPLALELLKNESSITVVRVSSTWRTKPVDTCCTDFLNTAALILSSLDHSSVKKNILAKIEEKLGRVRTPDKNAPRTIDIDIVAVNNEILEKNIFVLDHLVFPLAEIAPHLQPAPGQLSLASLAANKAKQTEALRVDYPATSSG